MDDHAPKRTVTFCAQLDERGGFYPEDARTVRARLARWAKRRVYVSVSLEPKRRSLAANALYWGWHLKILAEFTGHEDEELHEYFKWKYLRKHLVLPGGEEVETVRSTATLPSEEFSEYLSKIKRDAALIGCEIPDPNEEERAL